MFITRGISSRDTLKLKVSSVERLTERQIRGRETNERLHLKRFEMFSYVRGTVRTARLLDRETVGAFLLRVVAWDSGAPSLTTTSTITVSVEDVNDNPPFLVSSSIVSIAAPDLRRRENTPSVTTATSDIPTPFAPDVDWEKLLKNVQTNGGDFIELNEKYLASFLSTPGSIDRQKTNENEENDEGTRSTQMSAPSFVSETSDAENFPGGTLRNNSLLLNLTFGDPDEWAVGHGPPFSVALDSAAATDITNIVNVSFADGYVPYSRAVMKADTSGGTSMNTCKVVIVPTVVRFNKDWEQHKGVILLPIVVSDAASQPMSSTVTLTLAPQRAPTYANRTILLTLIQVSGLYFAVAQGSPEESRRSDLGPVLGAATPALGVYQWLHPHPLLDLDPHTGTLYLQQSDHQPNVSQFTYIRQRSLTVPLLGHFESSKANVSSSNSRHRQLSIFHLSDINSRACRINMPAERSRAVDRSVLAIIDLPFCRRYAAQGLPCCTRNMAALYEREHCLLEGLNRLVNSSDDTVSGTVLVQEANAGATVQVHITVQVRRLHVSNIQTLVPVDIIASPQTLFLQTAAPFVSR
ncbi:Cadherin-like [Trinorchestia longiramus]|nr:Cadherin-like [Trinorchestia longiramus]